MTEEIEQIQQETQKLEALAARQQAQNRLDRELRERRFPFTAANYPIGVLTGMAITLIIFSIFKAAGEIT